MIMMPQQFSKAVLLMLLVAASLLFGLMKTCAIAEMGQSASTNAPGKGRADEAPVARPNALPQWWERVKAIAVGTRRSQVESLLPTNFVSGVTSDGFVAGGRDFRNYHFADGWTVSIEFEAPMVTKEGIRTFDYGSPDERVIERPKITRRQPSSDDGESSPVQENKK